MAKPAQDPKWVTSDDPLNMIEPTAPLKTNGIVSGGIWGREHLNWMFNSLSKWVDWVRDNVRSNSENEEVFVQHTEVDNTLTGTSTTNPLSALQGKNLNDTTVKLTGTQTIAGSKTLSSAVTCNVSPSAAGHLTRKDYVDTNFLNLSGGTMTGSVATKGITSVTAGSGNLVAGEDAGISLTVDGDFNTLIGKSAGKNTTTGTNNTAVGKSALILNTVGAHNTAAGQGALAANTASDNSAFGSNSLVANTSGTKNTATGQGALKSNTSGNNNTSLGVWSSLLNTNGDDNTAIGVEALYSNTSGNHNVAVGVTSLYSNKGSNNTAVGHRASFSNTTGYSNVGMGYYALFATTTGHDLTSVGDGSLEANTVGNYNTALGRYALNTNTTGNNNIAIGYNANSTSATVSGECTLGDVNITNLRCNDTTITSLSDRRDKGNIQDIPLGLNFINTLRPVSFDWNRRDGSMAGRKDFGFIAQELKAAQEATEYSEHMRLVCEENPDRIEADPMKTYPILVKAIQELSAKVAQLETHIAAK